MNAEDTQYDELLREVFLTPLRECSKYKPKLGGSTTGVDFDGFAALYSADPLYHLVGLDSAPMYSAHRAAGGMTSIYRQLGIACERLFRQIVQLTLGLDDNQVKWSYKSMRSDGTNQTLTLDARIEVAHVGDAKKRQKVENWLARCKSELDLALDLKGVVFEVRQGYKSADSKRQNADLRSAMQATASGLLPVVMVFSRQINETVARRYRNSKLLVMTGSLDGSETESTFTFSRDVLGYDLGRFFERNTDALKTEIGEIVSRVVSPEL